jgi:hypothetical protein
MKNKEKAVKANPIYDIGQPINKAELVKYLLSDLQQFTLKEIIGCEQLQNQILQAFLESSDETEE